MPKPVETSRRKAIVEAVLAGELVATVAHRFGVSVSSAKRWVTRGRQSRSLEPLKGKTGPRPSLGAAERAIVERLCAEHPQLERVELARLLGEELGRPVPEPTLRRFMGRWGLLRQRPPAAPRATEPQAPEEAEKRYGYAAHHRREGDAERYPSSLTDAEWARVGDIFATEDGPGRPELYARRAMLDAIVYVVRSGCAWRMLPHEFPPWNSVYRTFRRWSAEGRFEAMHRRLREQWLEREHVDETVALIDSQSVKTSENGGPKGYDGGKKVKGRKRHLVTNALGLLLAVVVQTANVQDRDGADEVVTRAREAHPKITKLYADAGYAGRCAVALRGKHGLDVRIMRRSDDRNGQWKGPQLPTLEPPQSGFKVMPLLWRIERAHAWNIRPRRLGKDLERLPEVSETYIWLAQATMLLRRIDAAAA